MTGTASGVVRAAAADPEAAALPILPYWPELVFGIVVFGIFLWLVAKYVVPRLETAYADRAAAIEGGMNKAEEAQREAEAALREYQAQLAEARAEAGRIREEAREQGAAIVAEMRQKAQAESTRIVEAAHRQLEADQQHAFLTLRGEIGRMSTDLASRIVGESLHDQTRQQGIVERFLAELESGSIRPESAAGSHEATVERVER